MSQIEIYKEEVLKEVNAFRKALETFETDVKGFQEVAGNLDGQNSDFVNQMKVMVEHIAEKGPKKLVEGLTNYVDEVEKVVNGIREVDEDLAKQLSTGYPGSGGLQPNPTYPLAAGNNSVGGRR